MKTAMTPAVAVSLNRAQPIALPTYTSSAKLAAVPTPIAKPPVALPAAKSPAPAAAAKPATAAKAALPAAKSPAPAVAAKPAAAAAGKAAVPVGQNVQAPTPDGALYATGEGSVKVNIMASESGYDNKIYWSSDNWATRNYLGVDNHQGSYELGNFAKGTKIDFAIDNGQGDFFKASGGNADGIHHAQASVGSGGLTLGFEDLRGGGDRDFNDAIVQISGVSNMKVSAPVAAPTPTAPVVIPKVVAVPPTKTANPVAPADPRVPPKPVSKDNRSGLGDGTNPGNGNGRVNSPNTGTANPNQARKPVQVAPARTVKQP